MRVLLDPLEEELDLPTIFVELGNRHGRQRKIVGEEHQRFSRFGIVKFRPPDIA
jgi:hypothetical protein